MAAGMNTDKAAGMTTTNGWTSSYSSGSIPVALGNLDSKTLDDPTVSSGFQGDGSHEYMKEQLDALSMISISRKGSQETDDIISIGAVDEPLSPMDLLWRVREDRIAEILLRAETIEVLEAVGQRDLAVIHSSYQHLHAFADLVSEDLISVEDGHPVLTPLVEEHIRLLSDKI